MTMQDWDDELNSAQAAIDSLLATQRDGQKQQRRSLSAGKVAAVQAQLRWERSLAVLQKLTSRDLLLLPRDRAMLHWGRIYTEHAARHIELLNQVLSKTLWLNLVRVRSGVSDLLDGDQLVGLSVRQANMTKTERYLRSAIDTVKRQQRQLVTTYHQLAVEKANRQAAVCMASRLGRDLADALSGPLSSALAVYLMRLTAGIRNEAATSLFQDFSARYQAKAQTLIKLCRNSVLTGDQSTNPTSSTKAVDNLAATMRQLGDLERGVKDAYRTLVLDQTPALHPKLKAGAKPRANAAKTR